MSKCKLLVRFIADNVYMDKQLSLPILGVKNMATLYKKYGNNDAWTIEQYDTMEEAMEEAVYQLELGAIVQVEE